MEENFLTQNQNLESNFNEMEPDYVSENSVEQNFSDVQMNGQSQDPLTDELILGKFKTTEDLSKAYQELEKRQGLQSDELGSLRKRCVGYDALDETFQNMKMLLGPCGQLLNDARDKYDSPEYFQNPSFEELYKEAFFALGDKLDSDKFVNLLECYVKSRIFASEKQKAAKAETQQAINSMGYSKNSKTSFTPPQKRFDEMSPKEIDELLEKLI